MRQRRGDEGLRPDFPGHMHRGAALNNCCDLSERYVGAVLGAVGWHVIFVGTPGDDGALTKKSVPPGDVGLGPLLAVRVSAEE